MAPHSAWWNEADEKAHLRRSGGESWGHDALFLKVRVDNAAAIALYESCGYELVETREVVAGEMPAWQERWKGGVLPLCLMRKAFADVTQAVGSGEEPNPPPS